MHADTKLKVRMQVQPLTMCWRQRTANGWEPKLLPLCWLASSRVQERHQVPKHATCSQQCSPAPPLLSSPLDLLQLCPEGASRACQPCSLVCRSHLSIQIQVPTLWLCPACRGSKVFQPNPQEPGPSTDGIKMKCCIFRLPETV